MRKGLIGFFVLFALTCFFGVKRPTYAQSAPRGNVSNGVAIYQERCAKCHGIFGMGDGELAAQSVNPPTAFGNSAYAANSTPALLYDVISNGRPMRGMPPFGDTSSNPLSEQERWDVIGAIYALGTRSADFQGIIPPILATNWQTTTQKAVESENNLTPVVAQAWRMAGFDYWLGRGIVSGKVIDGASGVPIDQAIVTLLSYEEGEIAQIYTTTTGINGVYQFVIDDVPADIIMRPQFNEGESSFTGNFVRFTPGVSLQSADIVRYERSSDLASLRFDQLRSAATVSPDGLVITQLYQWTNIAEKLFVAPLTLFVPEGAENISVKRIDDSGQLRPIQSQTEGAQWTVDTQLLPQTVYQLLVQYQFPYKGEQTIEHLFIMPPIQSTLLVQEGLRVVGWEEIERQSADGETFISYRRNGDSSWKLEVSGYPRFSVDPTTGNRQLIRNEQQELMIGVVALVVAVFAATALIYHWQKNRPSPDTILLKVAELDDALALGTLSAEQHATQRAELLSHL